MTSEKDNARNSTEFDQMVWELLFALQGVVEGHSPSGEVTRYVEMLVQRNDKFFGQGAWLDLCAHHKINWPELKEALR